MHQERPLAHRGEDVRLLTGLVGARPQRRVRGRRPGRLAQLGVALDPDDLPQVGEVERAVDPEHLILGEVQPLQQAGTHVRVGAGLQLQPYDLTETAPAQLVLDRLQQVVGLVRDLKVGVPRYPE